MRNNSPQLSDWLQKISEGGDLHAFRLLVEHYSPALHAYALTLLRQQEVAEEVVSDVFLKMWHRRSDLKEIENLQGYLFRAVKNQSLSQLRKKNPRVAPLKEDVVLPSSYQVVSPEEGVLINELHDLMNLAIESLPPNCKKSFQLVREEGLSYRAAAAELNISENTLKTHLSRAIKKLRQVLSGYQSVTSHP